MKCLLVACILVAFASVANAEEPMFRLGVNASFDDGNMRILEVNPEGPAGKLHNDGTPRARLEAGDIIEKVDGNGITSYDDLVRSLNSSLDGYVALTVRDVNSGNSMLWYTMANPTARNSYEQLRDTLRRAVRNKEVPMTEFFFVGGPQFASSNISSVIKPLGQDNDQMSGEDILRTTLIGIACIQQDPSSSDPMNVFSKEAFANCDEILKAAFDQIASQGDQQQGRLLAMQAQARAREILGKSMGDWARRNNKKLFEEATMPKMVSFNVRTPKGFDGVQVLLAADKAVQLKNGGFPVRPVNDAGRRFLSNTVRWTPLPAQNATAYGRYYYRFVKSVNGRLEPEAFDENRVVLITSSPPNNELLFQ
jgi:hypothetical protein